MRKKKFIYPMKSSSATILNARSLRKSQTYPEKLIWERLRNRRFMGLKFRRQFPIGIYITDSYCPEKDLIIEINGKIHDRKEQKIWDYDREMNLKSEEFNIIRFKANDVIDDIESVLLKLAKYINKIHE